MPVDLTPHCKGILHDIVTTSERIRHSALAYADSQNFQVSERLRSQLDKIRTSADTILAVITEASLTNYTIDDGLVHWLFSGEPQACSAKLKEIDTMLKPINLARPLLRPGEDKLAAAMVFFDRHKCLFHFLTTPDVWNRERLLHQPSRSGSALQANSLLFPEGSGCCPQESQSSNVIAAGAESSIDHTSKVRHLKDTHRRQLEEISRWLAASNCTDKHNHIHLLRQEGTCKWFPNTNVYEKWRTRGAQFLWLCGKAGCGKSVLVASTIEHLKTTLQYEEVVIFYYFDFQNERSRSPVEMMRSLLSQLCRHFLDLDVDPGSFPNRVLEEKSKDSHSLSDLDTLRSLVSCAADRFVREPIVVIDALDECVDIESLLRALVDLHDNEKVRLLVTSRPHQDMMRHFTKLPSLSFEDMAMELSEDIKLHVERDVSHNKLTFASPAMKKEIHAKLNEKAEGRFRWVQCQIDILKRCTSAQELKKALDNLPSELEATYERILGAIDERKLEGHLARRVLNWLIVALEPLRLTQILDALSVDFPSQRNIIREGVGLIDMLSSLVSHCEKTDVVSLSHFSVKEFLIDRTTLPMYRIDLYEAHAAAVQTCMHYISSFLKQAPFPRNVSASESWPMLSYVFSSGFHHLDHLDLGSSVVLDALQSLGSDLRHHPSHWDRLCQLREDDLRLLYPPWPLSRHDIVLYILIAYGSIGLFQQFLSSHQPVEVRVGTNPLVYATDLRKTDYAIALLVCGANVNAQSLAIDDSHHVSPLEVSIDRDDVVLVGELLQRGCLVTSELLTTAICMPWCSARVLVKLMHTHEFEEWACAIGDEELYRCIFSSARPNSGDIRKADEDHVALARRLHQIGQDLSADSPFGVVLIERALYAAHTSMLEYLLPADQPPPARFLLAASTGNTPETVSIVRFLLRRGVDINVVSARGDTVLHLAAICPWEPRSLELTKMLIDAGCNPYIPNLRGETPLTIAVDRKYLFVADRLLLSNIPPPPDTLLNALQRRYPPKIVRLLVRNGADVNFTLNGETVFHLAITKYEEPLCLELVETFIHAGCDTAICSSEGETPVHTAIEHGYTSVVDKLLHAPRKKAHVDSIPSILEVAKKKSALGSRFLSRKTAVDLEITRYDEPTYQSLVENLVEAGGNIHGVEDTTLQTAIKSGYTSVVQFLLSHNNLLRSSILPFMLQRCSPPHQVQILLHSGADVHSTSSEGDTVFHLAITNYDESACLGLVKNFIGAGGDANVCNSTSRTVLQAAIHRGYASVIQFLLSHNILLGRSILPFALQQRSPPQLVQLLICYGADTNSTSPEGETIFHLAIANYHEPVCLELAKSFLKAGGNANIRNSTGQTVLQAAIHRGYSFVAELLFSENDPLWCGMLPFALQQRSPPRLVQRLIHDGVDVHSTSSEGETAFHLAIANYDESVCLELVKSFVGAGGNPNICNATGQTVLQAAVQRGHLFVVKFLLSHEVPLPRGILPFVLQQCSPPQLIRFLIRNGVDLHSTSSDGESIFHLAIANYDEFMCLELVKSFVDAGGSTNILNSKGKTVLQAAIKRGYFSVVETLLSYEIPMPPAGHTTTFS